MSVIVTKSGQKARRVEPGKIPHETYLQEYIVSNPEALPLSDLRDDLTFLIVAREFPTASGPIDAVGLDDEGNLYLVETKLYRNPDKRQVLAQVLDYGAALWKRHGDSKAFRDQLEETARQTLEMDLSDKVCEAFAIDADEAEDLLTSVEKQVSEGRFRFVVLMDRLDDRLKDLISFINENSRFDVFGVELQFYRFDDYEITIPKLYGTEVRKVVERGGSRRRWDEARYFEDAEKKLPPHHLASLRQLYEFAVEHADRVSWGTGAKTGSFNPKYDRIGPRSVYTANSDGRLFLNFEWLRDEEKRLPDSVASLASRMEESLTSFALPEDFAGIFVTIPVDVWAPQVESLITAIREELGAT